MRPALVPAPAVMGPFSQGFSPEPRRDPVSSSPPPPSQKVDSTAMAPIDCTHTPSISSPPTEREQENFVLDEHLRDTREVEGIYGFLTLQQLSLVEKSVVVAFSALSVYFWCFFGGLDSLVSKASNFANYLVNAVTNFDNSTQNLKSWAMSVILAVIITVVFDMDTAATDQFILTSIKALRNAATKSYNAVLDWSRLALATARATVQAYRLLKRRISATPLVVRYIAIMSVFVPSLRYLLFCTTEVVAEYSDVFLGVVVVGSVVIAAKFWINRRNRRTQAVQSLARGLKTLLLSKQEDDGFYPAIFLREEVTAFAEYGTGAEVDLPVLREIELQGLSVGSIWDQTSQLLRRDSKFQPVEKLFRGRRQLCWRILSPSSALPSRPLLVSTTASSFL